MKIDTNVSLKQGYVKGNIVLETLSHTLQASDFAFSSFFSIYLLIYLVKKPHVRSTSDCGFIILSICYATLSQVRSLTTIGIKFLLHSKLKPDLQR